MGICREQNKHTIHFLVDLTIQWGRRPLIIHQMCYKVRWGDTEGSSEEVIFELKSEDEEEPAQGSSREVFQP